MLKLVLVSLLVVATFVTNTQTSISDKPLLVKAFGNLSPFTYEESVHGVLCAPCRRCNCACKLPNDERLAKIMK